MMTRSRKKPGRGRTREERKRQEEVMEEPEGNEGNVNSGLSFINRLSENQIDKRL